VKINSVEFAQLGLGIHNYLGDPRARSALKRALDDMGVEITEDDEPESLDYSALAQSVEQMKEVVMALTAGMEANGFTPREARALVAGLISMHNKEKGEEDS
jgi:hypothetical protein